MADKETAGGAGCLGSVVAVVLSMKLNGSIGWAVFHMFCGWLYVLYALLFRWAEIDKIFF